MKSSLVLLLSLLLLPLACRTTPEKVKMDIDSLTRQAEEGNSRAQYELGALYTSLWNAAEANKWYRQSAERGNADAQYALGMNCLNGDGVPKDIIEAYVWFNLAAMHGSRPGLNARNKIIRRMSKQELEEGNRRSYERATNGSVPRDSITREIAPNPPAGNPRSP